MAENTKIEWATHTVNFWWGCQKVSAGCANCYAETLSHRFGKSIWGSVATTDRERKSGAIANLRKWNRQAAQSGETVRVFAQSMSDFFEDHPQLFFWRAEAIGVIEECEDLIIMLLTKRPENILRMVPAHWLESWPAHVWIGASVENQDAADKRIPELLRVPAAVRFLSMEPLLGPVDLKIGRWHWDPSDCPTWFDWCNCSVDWVIVGGESGHNARPIYPDWARSIRDQCVAAGVPFFFKQWGEWVHCNDYPPAQEYTNGLPPFIAKPQHRWNDGTVSYKVGKHAAGRILDGRIWDEYPAVQP